MITKAFEYGNSSNFQNAFKVAIISGHKNNLELLINEYKPGLNVIIYGATQAAECGQVEIMSYLLSYLIDKLSKEQLKGVINRCFEAACIACEVEAVDYLLLHYNNNNDNIKISIIEQCIEMLVNDTIFEEEFDNNTHQSKNRKKIIGILKQFSKESSMGSLVVENFFYHSKIE